MKTIAEDCTAVLFLQPADQMLASLFPRCPLTNAPQSEGLTNVLTPYGDEIFLAKRRCAPRNTDCSGINTKERRPMSEPSQFPTVDCPHGVKRQVLSENPELMVVSFTFPEGGKGDLHQHPHTQSTYVESGRFTFTVGDSAFEVGPGDSFVIPSNAEHGCVCHEPGRLIDTFTPRRDDFL